MIYSEELKTRIRKTYGDKFDVEMEAGDNDLGVKLYSVPFAAISIEKIINAVSLEDLQKQAIELKEKGDIYLAWNSENQDILRKEFEKFLN